MTDDKGSASNPGVRASFSRLFDAVQNPDNQKNLMTQGRNLLRTNVDRMTAFATGAAPPAEQPPPPTSQAPPPPAAPPVGGTPTTTPPPSTAETTAPPPPASTPGTNEKKDQPKAEEKEDEMGWVATAMFNFLPDGVKDWAGTAAIPLATQGQALVQKFGRPKVSKSPAAYFTCMTGDKITEIPESVFDYSKKIIKMLGLGDNPELAEAISVGFISFLRTHISRFLPMVKAFENTAQGPAKISDLIGFGANAQTLIGLFKLAPADQQVEPMLVSTLKDIFKSQGISNIDHYFQSNEMNYGQFVSSYAALGRDMVASKKWVVDPAKVTDDMKKTADEAIKKYGIADPDGSLALGLAAASAHGADLLKLMTSPPPAPTPGAEPPKPGQKP